MQVVDQIHVMGIGLVLFPLWQKTTTVKTILHTVGQQWAYRAEWEERVNVD